MADGWVILLLRDDLHEIPPSRGRDLEGGPSGYELDPVVRGGVARFAKGLVSAVVRTYPPKLVRLHGLKFRTVRLTQV